MIDITAVKLHDKYITPEGFEGRVQGLIRERGERVAVLLSFTKDRPHPPEFDIRGGLWRLVAYPPEMLEPKNGK